MTHVYNNPVVWSLTVSVAIVGSNSLALGPIAPDIARDLQTDLASILQASAAFGGGTAVSAFFLAKYIDHVGIKAGLCTALLVLTLAFIGTAISMSAWHLVLAQFVAGIAAGVALPACYSGAAVIAPPEQSSRVLGIVLTGWTISLVMGVTLSTLIADSIHWRSVYALFAIVAASITFYNVVASLPGKPPAQNTISMLSAFAIKGVPSLLLQVACYMTAFYGVYNLVGDHVVSTLNYSLSTNALVALSYGIGFGLATLFDPVIDSLIPADGSENKVPATTTAQSERPPPPAPKMRITFKRSSITAMALMALALLYFTLAIASASLATLIIVTGVWGMLNHIGLNILIASLNATNTRHRGAVLGLYSGITYVCMSIGTVIFSSIYQWGDFWLLCLVGSALCLLGTLVAVLWRT